MFATTKSTNKAGRTVLNTQVGVEKSWKYSRALVDGRWIFLSATSGADYNTMFLDEDVVVQAKQSVENIRHVLEELGSGMDDVVRYNLIIKDPQDLSKVRDVIANAFDGARPVHGVLCCDLPRPEIKIEIEVTALRQAPPDATAE